jgi:Trm5-related predicted tRNA methylase
MPEREPQLEESVITPEGEGTILARAQVAVSKNPRARWRLRVGLAKGGFWTGFDTELVVEDAAAVEQRSPSKSGRRAQA